MEKITVIIPAWNEEKALKDCVDTIKKSNPEASIIVANNGSTDKTQEWLEQQQLDFIYFDEGVQTLGKVFNTVLDHFEMENYVFFLWPQTIVGKNTLHEMVNTLDSGENIGVVGCCSNEKPYEQNIEVFSYEELLEFEHEKRRKVKQRRDCSVLGNVGLCFGMKRSLLEQLGRFDENLSYTDVMVDYQLRAIKENYKNMVSSNAYSFEVEGNEENAYWINCLRHAERDILRKKWNMNYFMLSANYKFNFLIHRSEEESFSVLEVGCDMGANLLGIKNQYPNCRIYGLEINKTAAELGSHIANIRYGNIEEENVDFGEKFDYIIFGDVLEHLHNPQKTVRYCKELLKENGRIIASIPNVMHISVMNQLLSGEFRYTDIGLLDKTHIHLFTQKEIIRMFAQENYEIEEMQGVIYELEEDEERLLGKLMDISGEQVTEKMYKTYQYSVVARKCL